MNELDYLRPPQVLALIEADTRSIGFGMGSENLTGGMLRVLAASKPRAEILELGTGTGISAAWLLDGMDADSHLTTVDNDEKCLEIAKRHLEKDERITFHFGDGEEFLAGATGKQFDLIFADAWPGKYHHLDSALRLLKIGGFYVIDDLLPQPNWPEDHAPRVPRLIASLSQRRELTICPMSWSSGLLIAVRTI